MTEGGVSPIPREARPYQGHTAGLVTRFTAAVIDALVVGAVLLMGYASLAIFLFILDPRSFSFPETSLLLSLTSAFVTLVVYLTAAWSISGRTYGCHLMGLRVVNYRGQRLRPVGALLRAVLCAIFPIGLLWCAWSRANRSVQDVLLRTTVIYDWQPRIPRSGPGQGLGQEAARDG